MNKNLIVKNDRAFSRDVTAAILVFQNNKMAAMLVFQNNTVGVDLFSYLNNRGLFCMSMRDRSLDKEHATSDSDHDA